MPRSEKYRTPRETIAAYVEACRVGDVGTLRKLFAANALMRGFYQGDYYLGDHFTNLFQLALLDGGWLIASKAYIDG